MPWLEMTGTTGNGARTMRTRNKKLLSLQGDLQNTFKKRVRIFSALLETSLACFIKSSSNAKCETVHSWNHNNWYLQRKNWPVSLTGWWECSAFLSFAIAGGMLKMLSQFLTVSLSTKETRKAFKSRQNICLLCYTHTHYAHTCAHTGKSFSFASHFPNTGKMPNS